MGGRGLWLYLTECLALALGDLGLTVWFCVIFGFLEYSDIHESVLA